MGTIILEKDKPFLEDGVLQSLYYLYQELLKANLQDLATIIESAIVECEKITRKNLNISEVGEGVFKQFHIMRQFRQLSEEQKELFIFEMERSDVKH